MKNQVTRLLSAVLCVCLLLSFAACKKDDKKQPDPSADAPQPQDPSIPDIFGNQDKQPETPEPTTPEAPVVPPAPEVVRSEAYDTRVTSDEIVLHNGISIGMSYDEVAAYSGYTGEKPAGTDSVSFDWENITYTFVSDAEKGLKLNYINIAEEAADASIFRGIKIGDSLDSVFAKIPAKDTELKKWAIQFLYGYEDTDPKGYADLRFIALSYYTVNVFTPEYVVNITFAREAMTVKWVEISSR
jgi:hypothetical protein